jgi:multidrug transporter EmrE-like cation transporter
MSPRILLFVCILLGVIGQLALKRGINAVAPRFSDPLPLILHSLLNPLVILGFALYGIASVLWILVLSKLPLSIAYPAISVGYVLILLFSWFYLNEPLTINRIVAVALISIGFIMLGFEIRS